MQYRRTILLPAVFTILWLNSAENCSGSSESSGESIEVSEAKSTGTVETIIDGTFLPLTIATISKHVGTSEEVSDFVRYMNCSCYEATTQCLGAFSSSDFLVTPPTVESETSDSAPSKYNCSKASSNTWIICDERDDYLISNTEQCQVNSSRNISCKPSFGTFIINSSSYLELVTKNDTIVFLICKGALELDESGLHLSQDGEGREKSFTLIIILSVTCAIAVFLITALSVVIGRKKGRSSKLSKEQKTSSDPGMIYSNADNAVKTCPNTNRTAEVAKNPNKYPDTAAAYSSPYQVASNEQMPTRQPDTDSQRDEDTPGYSLASGNDTYSGLQERDPLTNKTCTTGDLRDSQNGGTNYTGCPASTENVDESADILETSSDGIHSKEASAAFPSPGEYARLDQHVRRKTRDNYDIWPLPFEENPAIQLMQLKLNN